MRRFIMLALLALVFALPAKADVFVFTAIPDQDESRLQERFDAVGDYLADALGVEVRYVPVKSYAAAVSAFRNNQVQLAWFGGLTGLQARARVPGSEALARGAEDEGFRSFFIANSSTGLEPGEQLDEALRDRTFTFSSRVSTSGRLMPEFHLRERFGESPDDIFARVGYSGNHSRTLRLVESGSYEVGVLNYAVWERELAAGNIDTEAVQVIWETPGYLNYQWSIRGDVDQRFGEGFTEQVREALLGMDDPDLLERFPRREFVPVTNEDYEELGETARAIGLID